MFNHARKMKCLLLKWGFQNDHFLLFSVLLAMSDITSAYITEPLDRVCTRDEELSNEYDLQSNSQYFQQRSLKLEDSGSESAALLYAKMSDPPCALMVEGPSDMHAITISMSNFPKGIACPLSLWSYDARNKNETWFLDLCDREKRGLLSLYPEVYPHRIMLRWNAKIPETYPKNDTHLARVLTSEEPIEIIVTSVARGALCDDESRVLCWKMMKESLCISEAFACDGKRNCPHPGNEESESMCPQRRNDHVMRVLAVRSGDTEMIETDDGGTKRRSGFGFKSVRVHPSGTTVGDADREGDPDSEKEDEEVEERSGLFGALPRLGPGSYVLMGVLTCGTILLLCGLWECCCRVGNRAATISLSQRGSLVTTGSNGPGTTTVVIISSTPPPQYEELDQPPNYRELFPARTKVTT